MMRCVAITHRRDRCQQTWRKDCENTACQVVGGFALCGTHINALARGSIEVRAELKTPPEFDRADR